MDDLKISIHAPTRGATRMIKIVGFIPIFQSTLPREERQQQNSTHQSEHPISIHAPTRGATKRLKKNFLSFLFQSTLPREERHLPRLQVLMRQHFNPRSHERSDADFIGAIIPVIDFNPRSHERSDSTDHNNTADGEISIHAPTRGATADSAY